MAGHSEFLDLVLDLLAPLGPIRARRMFAGFGLYCGPDFFAIVEDDVLYLKADALTRAAFEAWSPGRFSYRRQGRETALSYYEVPLDALEDGEMLCEWAAKALGATRRAKAP